MNVVAQNIAIIRIEQLYPFPHKYLAKILEPYKGAKDIYWVQEEPMNMGAWFSSQHHMRKVAHELNTKWHLEYAGRDLSASPAAGYMALHLKQQEQLIRDALDLQG